MTKGMFYFPIFQTFTHTSYLTAAYNRATWGQASCNMLGLQFSSSKFNTLQDAEHSSLKVCALVPRGKDCIFPVYTCTFCIIILVVPTSVPTWLWTSIRHGINLCTEKWYHIFRCFILFLGFTFYLIYIMLICFSLLLHLLLSYIILCFVKIWYKIL